MASDVIDVLGATVGELTQRLNKLGGDVSDMWYVSEEWHTELQEKYQNLLTYEQKIIN